MTSPVASWKDSRVLITGACGTVGRELLRQVVEQGPAEVIGLDNNESEIFFSRRTYGNVPKVKLYVGDVREVRSLASKMAGIDFVLHTAAYKHGI